MPNIGDIYTAIIYFRGRSGNSKPRPVLVLNDLGNGFYTIAEITSKKPKNPPSYYDQFKEFINGWHKCRLDEPSYVKCKNIHNIEGIRLHDYIGSMDYKEFILITKIILNYKS